MGIAQQSAFAIDPDKSTVKFELSATGHTVHGTFRLRPSTVRFSQGGQVGGMIVVDAGSGSSGDKQRDEHMKKEGLKTDNFREVTFAPKRYTGVLTPGDSDIVVSGTITLLNIAHEISVPMHVHMSDSQCNASGAFAIPFTQWGVKDPSHFIFRVGKEVTMRLELAGSLASALGN